jgi:hypothetical protein
MRASVPKKRGRIYLRPITGTGMPSRERFQHAPFGACIERRLLIEISRFVMDSSRSYAN